MKTFLLALMLITTTGTLALAGENGSKGTTAGAASIKGLTRHSQSVWADNAVVFGYAAEKGSTYTWIQEEGPSRARITGQGTPTLLASQMQPGWYVFALTTTLPSGASATDRIVVKVKSADGAVFTR